MLASLIDLIGRYGREWRAAKAAAAPAAPLVNLPVAPIGAHVIDSNPIIICASGWRCGSTLVQRLVMSSGAAVVWGEPYHECGLIQALADGLRAYRKGWPKAAWLSADRAPAELADVWIANLFPSEADLVAAHQELVERLFARPASARGVGRWGVKEVRWSIVEASYLKWLYPSARLVFLHRHPLDAYHSYRVRRGNWRLRHDTGPVLTPTRFGTQWRHITDSFLEYGDQLGVHVVAYEDLKPGHLAVEALENHCGVRFADATFGRRLGGAATAPTPVLVSSAERWLLSRAAGPAAARLGYHW